MEYVQTDKREGWNIAFLLSTKMFADTSAHQQFPAYLSFITCGDLWSRHIERKLTLSPLDKMAVTLADVIFKCIFLNMNDKIPIQISMRLVPKCNWQ